MNIIDGVATFLLVCSLLILWNSINEKFGIHSGNITGRSSGSTRTVSAPRPNPPSPRPNPPSPRPPSPIPRPPSPRFIRPFYRPIYHRRNRYWSPRGYYYWSEYPYFENSLNYIDNPNLNYYNNIDCNNNCCDQNVCLETGGICEWRIGDKMYRGKPEECVRHKECIARNISDGNTDVEAMCEPN